MDTPSPSNDDLGFVPQQEQPVPLSNTQGPIIRPGQASPPVAAKISSPTDDDGLGFQPAPTQEDRIAAQLKDFDYSKSALRHILSEDTARAVVQASLRQQGIKDTINGNMTSAGLFFLSDNVKNHMSTALQAMGSNQSWDDLADSYGAMRKAQDKANPTAAALGQVLGKGAAAISGAGSVTAGLAARALGGEAMAVPKTIYPALGAAAGRAANVVLPMAQKVAYWVMHGAGLGAGYALYHKIKGD